jgi:hypothetical protein
MKKALWGTLLAVAAALALTVIWFPRSGVAQGITALTAGKAGDPIPPLVQVIGGSDSTNTRALLTDGNGTLTVQTRGVGFNNAAAIARICDRQANMTTLGTTATVTQITGVAAQNIYLCGLILSASTATTGTAITMTEGTGANCGTGTATIGTLIAATPTAPTAAPQIVEMGPAMRLTATGGDSLCFTQASTANSTSLVGTIFYSISN